LDAAEYSHVVPGFIFIRSILAWEELWVQLLAEQAAGATPEGPEECWEENISLIPLKAYWSHLHAYAIKPAARTRIDDAMGANERISKYFKTSGL
jgi:hypothetical protein